MGRKALEVLQDIADQLGWRQPTTLENEELLDKDQRKLLRAFNRVLRAVAGIDDWRFLRKEGEITLEAAYTTGLMRLTNGSTSVSGQDDPDVTGTELPVWTSSMVGRAVVINGHPIVYRVASVTSATALTLDRAFLGTTSDGSTVDDYAYQLVQDRYDLPADFDRPIDEDWTRHDENSTSLIRIISPKEMAARRRVRPAYSTSDPDTVSLWKIDDAGEHRIATFDPFPDTARLVSFEYQATHPKMENDTQRILYDQKTEEMILSGVEFLILRGPEDDARTGLMLDEFLRQQMAGVSKTEIGNQRTRLRASQERALQQRTKWARKARRIDWGAYFDRANFHDLG